MKPGISERTFEFCYNAEFCQRHQALLATHPHIPSQNEEKDLGYDVEFEIKIKRYTKSIFLQHKVAYFAENKAGLNARFYNAHNGPYYRFAVGKDQHNTLVKLARSHGNAYYCAPRFHTRQGLEKHFRANTIARNALLLNPLEVGEINDDERHNVTYSPVGYPKIFHSEPRYFEKEIYGGELLPPLKEQRIDENYIEVLSQELISLTMVSKLRKPLFAVIERYQPTRQAQIILGRLYNVSWLLLP